MAGAESDAMSMLCKTGVVLLALAPLAASSAEVDLLSGQYGHGASEPAYTPVWEVRQVADGWQARNLQEPVASTATRLSLEGRRAFWEKMAWPVASADTADCVTWGEAPPSLGDWLEDKPVTAIAGTFGNALVCHVPAAARTQIGWLQGSPEDWFYYDPMAGVMEVRQLR